MRRSLLRGIAALTMTGSLAVFMTAIQPTLAHAQTVGPGDPGGPGTGSGTGSTSGLACYGTPPFCKVRFPCLMFGPCKTRFMPPKNTAYCGCV